MPNGGSANCAHCTRNKAVEKTTGLSDLTSEQRKTIDNLSYCELHDVRIRHPHWTYCRYISISNPQIPASNAADALIAVESNNEDTPQPLVGAIWTYYESQNHMYIPWHGQEEPKCGVACVCTVCENKTDKGIIVIDDGEQIGFCGNDHYVDWWKTKHDDPYIFADKYGFRNLDPLIKEQIRKRAIKRDLKAILRGISIALVVVIMGILLFKFF